MGWSNSTRLEADLFECMGSWQCRRRSCDMTSVVGAHGFVFREIQCRTVFNEIQSHFEGTSCQCVRKVLNCICKATANMNCLINIRPCVFSASRCTCPLRCTVFVRRPNTSFCWCARQTQRDVLFSPVCAGGFSRSRAVQAQFLPCPILLVFHSRWTLKSLGTCDICCQRRGRRLSSAGRPRWQAFSRCVSC